MEETPTGFHTFWVCLAWGVGVIGSSMIAMGAMPVGTEGQRADLEFGDSDERGRGSGAVEEGAGSLGTESMYVKKVRQGVEEVGGREGRGGWNGKKGRTLPASQKAAGRTDCRGRTSTATRARLEVFEWKSLRTPALFPPTSSCFRWTMKEKKSRCTDVNLEAVVAFVGSRPAGLRAP